MLQYTVAISPRVSIRGASATKVERVLFARAILAAFDLSTGIAERMILGRNTGKRSLSSLQVNPILTRMEV